jgi:phage terminase large subunit-like protein
MRGENSKIWSIGTLPPGKLNKLIREASDYECLGYIHDWRFLARQAQRPPAGAWRNWLILAGRGFGKTRTGAEWVREQVRRGAGRIGLIAPTAADARDIMVEGESGLLSVCWKEDKTVTGIRLGRPVFERSRRRLVWQNGAVAMLFSAEEPERLRGPQHDALWADELAAWRYLRATWDMAMFGLRLGVNPQACITTTPKPRKLLRELMADAATAVTGGATFDNRVHLAAGYIDALNAKYQGTTLGRQEIHAEIIDQRKGALWSRGMLDGVRCDRPGGLRRIVVAVDPPASAKETSDACGIVAVGLTRDGGAHVLEDATVEAARPDVWAARAVALYRRLEADLILAEVNQGGDMVEAVIRQVDRNVPLKKARAMRGKWLRAEPVFMLYQKGRVTHEKGLGKLEDEMCAFGSDGLASGRSPDRLDALVWALTELLLAKGEPRVRGL